MSIVFLGPPGSGKGTLAKKLAQEHGFKQVSTGDLLRAEIKQGTELGKKVKGIIEGGDLVSDEIINELMEKYAEDKTLYDGYPRTIGQAKALEKFAKITSVIFFKVSEEVVVDRLSGRRICPKDGAIYHIRNIPPKQEGICDNDGTPLMQRKDDQPETIKGRFKVYETETKPLVEFYQTASILKEIDANGDVDSIFKQIKQTLDLE